MKKHFSSHLVLLTLIFLVGCSPSSEAIQKAIEQTQTALPTNTSVSTEDEMQIEEQEQLYFQTMTPLFQKFVIDFEIANTKTQEIGQDIYIVLNDKNYKDGYYSSIDLVYSDLEELSLVPAPSSLTTLQTSLQNAKTEWDLFRSNMKKGLDDLEASYIDIATGHLISFNGYMKLINSNFETVILQPTPENNNTSSEQILGTWYDTWAFKRTVTITKDGDNYYMKEVYSDGSSQTITLGVKIVGGETRLFDIVNAYGDYMVIKSDGSLAFYDNQGFIYEIKP